MKDTVKKLRDYSTETILNDDWYELFVQSF